MIEIDPLPQDTVPSLLTTVVYGSSEQREGRKRISYADTSFNACVCC